MWGGFIAAVSAGTSVFSCTDPATSDDYGCVATFRREPDGTLHLLGTEVVRPRGPRTVDMRLVPGSDPPRYEPV